MPGGALAYPAYPIRRFPQDNRHQGIIFTRLPVAKRFDGDHNSVTS
ncbi:hypothetical protein D088_770067 [Salmonella enterica subsp. houtenae serovar 16:z4,z32:-- str. RKS3027]|nr:hypothetical protein D088_770067 [Salmonella enterica subsp. houtenae serovar 16:z4,z32:-- str. RKS3027]